MPVVPRWRRFGKKSGPCNVLDGRYWVQGGKGKWFVYDRQRDERSRSDFPTMRLARRAAETFAELGHVTR